MFVKIFFNCQLYGKKCLHFIFLNIKSHHMAPNVSKNAKTARGAGTKNVLNYKGKEVEVCPAKFFGKTAGMKNYMAVEDKNAKTLLLDDNGMPLVWAISNIEKKKIG